MAVNSLLNNKNEIIVVSAIKGTTSIFQSMMDKAQNGLNYHQSLHCYQRPFKRHSINLKILF
ncbi:hypothetical protein LDG_8811 [Legionella drancourtii LLAP12]|uniref:Uncharacterized protein n=1 Tax=Legionella drancourtii LLAP12 TaxID=658187 RepID=G9EU22_9GAMM|nr:hypothetical protein LDG_8811 [Legionella drancourtii LLAP12]